MERVAALGGNRKIKAACIFVSFSQSLNQNPNWLSKCSFQKQPFLKFRNFHRKTHLLVSHFNDMAGLHACIFIKKRLEHRCFPVNTAKFLRTTFFTEHLWWLLLSFIKAFLDLESKFSLSTPNSFTEQMASAASEGWFAHLMYLAFWSYF